MSICYLTKVGSRFWLFLALLGGTHLTAYAQGINVTGRVTSQTEKTGIPGVSVSVKGTTSGTVTNANGEYTLNVSDNATLVFSYIGYVTEEMAVGGRTRIDVEMVADIKALSEVVVIGYGEREKKDITGAISTVDAKDIAKSSYMSPQLALQGRTTGVFVSTPSGNPFDRPQVRIRGVSTFGYADPLYVIDGVPITEGFSERGNQDLRTPINILTLVNPNDIESISVLKDASSAAIYGVRASNGVILITTKKGKKGTPKVELSATRGVQNVIKTFDVLNTQQYTQLYREAFANNTGFALPSQFDPGNPNYLGNSPTYNWQNELINKNAIVEDYSVRVSGGSESTTYYVSGGYGKTEGSLKQNSLERYSLATNVDSKISRIFSAGLTFRLTYSNAVNNTNGDLRGMATAPPWQPVYSNDNPYGFAPASALAFIPNPDLTAPTDTSPRPLFLNPIPRFVVDENKNDDGYNKGVKLLWGDATRTNPFGIQALSSSDYYILQNQGSAYLQVEPLPGLRFKGTLRGDIYYNRNKSWQNYDRYVFSQTPGNPYVGHDGTAKGRYGERQTRNTNLVKEFSINFNRSFGEHNVDVLLNAMDQQFNWEIVDASSGQVNFTDVNLRAVSEAAFPYTSTFTARQPDALQGYLGRLSYKFRDKYYLDATVRRDGSSRFPKENRWGTFPAISAAWRISGEEFMKNLTFINDLKIRGGWGELGNYSTTGGFAYLSTVSVLGPKYAIGLDPSGIGTKIYGSKLSGFPNYSLTWEKVQTTNVGFDAMLFDNRISLTVEYYNRLTNGIIQTVQLPPNTGVEQSVDLNVAQVRNRGMEFQVGFNQNFGDVAFNVSANLTTVNNKVLSLYSGQPFNMLVDGRADERYRIEEGYPIGYIRGYKVGGIFQNAGDIERWKQSHADVTLGQAVGDTVGYKYQPGDMYFQDVAGNPRAGQYRNDRQDSLVNLNDRTYLGKTIPGYYYGFNLGASYKGIDVSVFFQGVGDVQKINEVRQDGEGMGSTGANQWATTLNRWTPTNPSTTMPRAVRNDPAGNSRFSSRWVENAGFLRLKNVQIGYSLPKSLLNKLGFIQNFRIFASSTNLLTFTDWTGIDPENDINPPTRQVMLGINATF